ncbi:FAD-dependent oxidoreductase [Mesorhizobium sp. M0663]|uniref:FAD-dependent oxidoreductase n=1 Tax=Mesorhizobium sp. M0663 TaxID=2956981 RepID=UPI00333A74A9
MRHSRHLAIVGGGIIGIATAWELMRRAFRQVCHPVGKRERASTSLDGRNSGVIHSFCKGHYVPFEQCGYRAVRLGRW